MGRHGGGPPDDPSDEDRDWVDPGRGFGAQERRDQGRRRSEPGDVTGPPYEEPERGYARRPYGEPEHGGFQHDDDYADPRYGDDHPDPRYATSDYPEDDAYPAQAGADPRYDDDYWQNDLDT